jgi:putative membrane protein
MNAIGEHLALVNACLNGAAAICLFAGWRAIKSGNRRLHGTLMASAFVISALFLVSYLTRVALTGTHRYPGSGMWKTIYLCVLISHMILAVATPPLAIRTLWLAVKKRFAEHRRIVRWTLPIWMYVSVTGVLVYLLLYHPPG